MKFGWIFTPFFVAWYSFLVCAVQRLPAVKDSFVWIGLNQKIWKWSPESGSHSELCADQCELRMACMPFLTLLLMQLFMRTLSKVYKMRALGTVSEMITTVWNLLSGRMHLKRGFKWWKVMDRLLYTGTSIQREKKRTCISYPPLRWWCTATKSSLTPTGTGSREQRLVRGNWEVGHRTAFLPPPPAW